MKNDWHVLLNLFGFRVVRRRDHREMKLRFDIFDFSFLVVKNLTKGTCWSVTVPKGARRVAQRMDFKFCIARVFLRKPQVYVTTIHLGNWMTLIGRKSQGAKAKEKLFGTEEEKVNEI